MPSPLTHLSRQQEKLHEVVLDIARPEHEREMTSEEHSAWLKWASAAPMPTSRSGVISALLWLALLLAA